MRSDGLLNQDQHSEENELLEYLLQAEGLEVSEEKRIVPRPANSATPLSFAQERLWFLDQLQPNSSVYNLAIVMRAAGPLQIEVLRRSLSEIVRRHEVLRTHFMMGESGPVQVVHPPSEFSLPLLDLSAMDPVEREKRSSEMSAEEAQRPFELARGPLIRALLIKLEQQQHLLVLNQHHIVSDGWSLGVLWRELGELYQAYASGEESPLTELAVQYGDYAVWQRDWLRGEALDEALEFWKKQLEKIPDVLELPADRPRPGMQTFKGAIYVFALTADLTEQLKLLARRENATLFMALCAAFQVLLSAYSGQRNFAIGTPHANRDRTELEKLIGFFINMLVLPADVAGNPAFRELLARVRERTLAAYAHQYLPFEKLVDELGLDRNLGHSPLFQVGFALQNTTQPAMHFGGLRFESVPVSIGASKYDLTLFMAEDQGRLWAMIEYSSDLFDEQTIIRFSQHFESLISSAIHRPDQQIRQLKMVSLAEQRMLEIGWGEISPDRVPSETVCSLVEKHAALNPASLALIAAGKKITYRELNLRANQMAQYLRKRGLKPGATVGVCLQRAPDVAVVMLGVMKAGGICLPLDADEPVRRIADILGRANASMVIAESSRQERLQQPGIELICLDRESTDLERESGENLSSGPESMDVACVLYRSSWTGQPEGVLLQHHVLASSRGEAGIKGDDRVALRINFSEDAGVLEIFRALAAGACIVELPEDSLLPRKLAEVIRKNAVSVLYASGRTLEKLARDFRHALKGVRFAVCAEQPSFFRRFQELLKNDPETGSRFHCVKGDAEAGGGWELIPLIETGEDLRTCFLHPVSGRKIYLLDEYMEPVPEGVVGEIYVVSSGLAFAYDSSPSLTAQTFLPDPLSGVEGGRLYRPGELARRRAQGTIEFLRNRTDRLLLNGIRVEPEEIERGLAEFPGVREAAVALSGNSDSRKSELLAFISTENGWSSVEELQAFAAESLPKPMRPDRYLLMDRIPRTPEGRADRRALLKSLENSRPDGAMSFASPRNSVEESLAKIWAEIFGLERVGIHDNFFALGGDSILSILAVTRASRAGIQITARQMFERQTIAGLASVAKVDELVTADQGVVSGSVPLTPAQLWFFEQNFQDQHHFNQAAMLATREAVAPDLLKQVVAAILQHHDVLRTCFSRDEGELRQEITTQETVDRVFAHVELKPGAEPWQTLLEQAANEWQASLNLQDGPLVRVVLFELGGNHGQRVLIVIHHLVIDGVSWRILLEDLEQGYRQLQGGQPINFGAKTSSFQQWARQLEVYAQSEEIKQQAEYWREIALVPVKPLPQDRNDGENVVSSASTVTISVGKEQTRLLLQEAPRAYRMQMHEVLITAFALAVRDWSGQDVVRMDLEGHGREDIGGNTDVTRTAGWFTAIFPASLDLRSVGDSGTALRNVKEQLRKAPERGLGYGLLRFLKKEQPLKALASELIFNYLGQFDRVLESGGVFQAAVESNGGLQSPNARRSYLLEVNALIQEGQLQAECIYSTNAHEHPAIQQLMSGFSRNLELLIDHCHNIPVAGYTPSDFPFVNISQDFLDALPEANGGIENIYPLVSMQEDMLLQSVQSPEQAVYFEQLVFGVKGLRPEIFQRAWQRVVDRHAALRARFAWNGLTRPVQIVRHHVEIELEHEDWREAENGNATDFMDRFLLRDRTRGFDLAKPPLMRLTLIRGGPGDWMVWSFHHILLDGWSGPVLMQEVFSCYQAFCQGKEPQLENPADYGDYIRWRQRQKKKEVERFWRDRLKDFPAAIGLSLEKRDKTRDTIDVGREKVQFSGEVINALERFARENQLTLNTVVQGAWALLLFAFTGNREATFGAWGSGRSANLAQIEKIVGALINTLPVCARVDERQDLVAWLRQIQEQQVEQRQHEAVDLTSLATWSGLPSGSPMFHTVLVFENYPVSASLGNQMNESGVQIFDVQAREQTHYPITVRVMPRDNLTLLLEYNPARYTRQAARQILAHFHQLLTRIAVSPNCQMNDLVFSPDQVTQSESIFSDR